jgi:hypothetical protein
MVEANRCAQLARFGANDKLIFGIRASYILLVAALVAASLRGHGLITRVYGNVAALATIRSAFQIADWETAERAWSTTYVLAPTSEEVHDRIFRFYRSWFAAQPDSAVQLAQSQAQRLDVPLYNGDALAELGDRFRGEGQLDWASAFYENALARNDFSTLEIASAVRYRKSVIDGSRDANLVANGNFVDGLRGWSVASGSRAAVRQGAAQLLCSGCRLEQALPLFGRGLYRLDFESRSDDSTSLLQVKLTPSVDMGWTLDRQMALNDSWAQYTEWVFVPQSLSPDLHLSLIQQRSKSVWLRNIRFQMVDTPSASNRLINGSFEHSELSALGGDDQFPSWDAATFWNDYQARGWRKTAPGNGSAHALELRLTQAKDYPYRIGVQQACADMAPGVRWELQADLFLPMDLHGAYAEVAVVIYRDNNSVSPVSLSVQRRLATQGWERITTAAQAPAMAGRYRCMFIVQLAAERPISDGNNIARIDNLVLRQLSEAAATTR